MPALLCPATPHASWKLATSTMPVFSASQPELSAARSTDYLSASFPHINTPALDAQAAYLETWGNLTCPLRVHASSTQSPSQITASFTASIRPPPHTSASIRLDSSSAQQAWANLTCPLRFHDSNIHSSSLSMESFSRTAGPVRRHRQPSFTPVASSPHAWSNITCPMHHHPHSAESASHRTRSFALTTQS